MGDEPEGVTAKAELRATMRARRGAMPPAEVAEASARIHARLEAWPVYAQASAIAAYVAKGNEVPTRPLLERALRRGRAVYVPVLSVAPRPVDARMAWSRLRSMAHLVAGPFGVPQPAPAHCDIADPPDDAVVLVPGLAFTRQGDRLGYGGGHFDRFLAAFRGASVGLTYDWQVLDALPVEAHDVPVACVVTPSSVYARA